MRHFIGGGNIYNSMARRIFYRVKRGETITRIAQEFSVTALKIINDNHLRKEPEAGDILCLVTDNYTIYRVKPSDTIEELSERFNVSPEEICEKNGVAYLFPWLEIIL